MSEPDQLNSLYDSRGWIQVQYGDNDTLEAFKSFKTYNEILNCENFEFITTLEFENHRITPEMILPPNLKDLWYGYHYPTNNEDELPELPEGLERFQIFSDSCLKKLPKLPSTLILLSLNEVDRYAGDIILPEGLKIFTISGNITKLPKLPLSLTHLYCSYCKLIDLPRFLPPYLKSLSCSHNKIKKIPPLPPDIVTLFLTYNPIKVLPISFGNLSLNQKLDDADMYTYYDCKSIFQTNFRIGKIDEKLQKSWYEKYHYTGPLADFIYGYCKEDNKQYGKYKWATDIISNWFLKIKYDPQYNYCRKRLIKEYEELIEESEFNEG